MRLEGHVRPNLADSARLDVTENEADAFREFRDHIAPGINDHRMPESLPTERMLAPLSGGDEVGLRLDGTGAEQGVPMRLAGGLSERGREGQHVGSERAFLGEELGEPEVITNREPESDLVVQIEGADLVASRVPEGLLEDGAVREIHVEEVDLSVAGDELSSRKDGARVVRTLGIRAPFGHPAADEYKPKLLRPLGEGPGNGPEMRFLARNRERFGHLAFVDFCAEKGKALRKKDHFSSTLPSPLDLTPRGR